MLQTVFVDTNILVCAHDKDAGVKRERANEIAAAARSGAERLLTEDLNDGQMIEGVLVSNPFAH